MTLQQNNIIAKVHPGHADNGFEVKRLVLKFRLPDHLSRKQRDEILSSLHAHQNIPLYISADVYEDIRFAMNSVKGLTSFPRELCLTTMGDAITHYVHMCLTFQSDRNLQLFLNRTGIAAVA